MEIEPNSVEVLEGKGKKSSGEFMARFGNTSKPAIIRGEAGQWQAMQTWSLDFLRDKFGSFVVNVTDQKPGAQGMGVVEETSTMPVADYIDYIEERTDSRTLYLKNWSIEKRHPELLKHYTVPHYLSNWLDIYPLDRRPSWKWIFLGPAGSGSPLHNDVWHTAAWLALISGAKEWMIFPPGKVEHLGLECIDAFDTNPERIEKANPYYCKQLPGEIIYIPSLWWHQVRNLETSLAVTENFVNAVNRTIFVEFLKASNLLKPLDRLTTKIPELLETST